MRILVTGSTGQVGSELPARLEGHEVLAPDRDDLDLADPGGLEGALRRAAPDAVVNCAAYNAVDGAEREEEAAVRVNADAVGVLARCCTALGAHLVHVSTDYVFPGDGGAPYDERDEPDPRSAYGRSKRRGELALLRSDASFALVRTAWVFGHRGRSFVEAILRRALAGESLRVVDDQLGAPTYARDLAGVLARLAVERVGGVLHVAGGGSCTWRELALDALGAAGLDDVEVAAIRTSDLRRPAPRPRDSRLASVRLGEVGVEPLRHHRDALGEAVPEMLAALGPATGGTAATAETTGGRR